MVARVILWIIEFYVVVLLLRAVLSWFPLSPGSPLQTVNRTLERVTEPVLAPVRRVLPPVRLGGTAIDLSMIVVLELVASFI